MSSAEDFMKAQQEEYGTFVAVQNISHDGVLAYLTGHAVPASNVKQYGYDKDGLVAKSTTKAAQAAVSSDKAV